MKMEQNTSTSSRKYQYLYTQSFLHFREDGQSTSKDLRGRDFRKHLEEREQAAREKRDRGRGMTCQYLPTCPQSVMKAIFVDKPYVRPDILTVHAFSTRNTDFLKNGSNFLG